MMRHLRTLALAALASLTLPSSTLAHGVQGRAETPVPFAVFFWAAAAVVIVSFVALGVAWSRPRWQADRQGRRLPAALERLLLSPVTLWVVRLLVLAGFLLVVAAALFGSTLLNRNIAPISVFVLWWVGLVPLSLLVGNVWREVNPWHTIAVLLRLAGGRRPYPERWGLWPAAVLLVAWSWLELVFPTASYSRLLGVLIVTYSAFTVAAIARYGTEWLDKGEVFSVFTRLLGTMSPFVSRETDGRRTLCLRAPIVGSTQVAPVPGLVAFVSVLIGAVTFDGLTGTDAWGARELAATERVFGLGLDEFAAGLVVATYGLVLMILAATAAFEAAAWAADRLAGLSATVSVGRIAELFAHSLLPIAVGYHIAHYFTLFTFQTQDLVRLASDPFGTGANLFGTTDFAINFNVVSANVIWGVQVASIVVAHVLGLMLAHDRALALAPGSKHAVRSQYPMLALMVLLTVAGLWFLSEGMNEAS